jgi:uncharacterized protein (DUF1800 family)
LWRQNELFRGFAFGDFRQLAKEIPRDPAMMRYLDIANSSKSKPNENFARELMELFLLGEGNYSEEDIRESARAFTGYRIDPMSQEVRFQGQRADTGTKTFFGKTGAFTSDDIVEILVNQPQCARFITGKLWNFFAGSPPTEKTQAALAETFRSSGFQTAAVLKAMFLSPEFYSKEVMKSQIKSPVDWMVGSSKRLESPLTGSRAEQNALRDLGQSLFEPPNVKGWEGGRTWVSASTFILRCNLAGTLLVPPVDLKNAFPTETRKDPETLCDAACLRLLGGAAPDRETFLAFLKTKESPASDATVSDLLRLMMNSPEFQLT